MFGHSNPLKFVTIAPFHHGMRLAFAGLIIAIACTAPAAAQPSPAAIRAQIEDIARTPRDQLTTAQREKAQALLEQLYQLEVVAPGPPPKPLSSAASEMLLDDSFDDICAFGLDYYNGRKKLAWAFVPPNFDDDIAYADAALARPCASG